MAVGKSNDPKRKNKPFYCTYRDQNKIQHRIYFRLEREAKEFERQTLDEVKKGAHTPAHGSKTVVEACELWLEECEKIKRLAPGTMLGYRDHVQRYVIPRLGMFKLAKLTTDHVKKCIDGINGSVSAKTASRVLYVVRAALRYAQDNMGLGQNVAMSVKAPWINRRNEPKVGITMSVPSPQDAVRLIDGAGATLPQIKALVMTALFTGLRWKELRLLTWDDVNFDENVIIVRKAKTAAGVRRYPMSPELKNELLKWQLVCPRAGNPGGLHTSIVKAKEIERLIRAGKTQRQICQEVGVTHYAVVAVRAMMRRTPASVHSSKAPTVERRIRAAANYNEVVPPGRLNYVFPTQGGTMRSYASGIERMRTLQRKLGMLGEDGRPKYVPHRTRHFLASWGIKQGWPLKELSVMLGHSSIRETLDTYGHLFADPEADQKRMAKSDAAFRALGLGGAGQPAEVVNLKDAARKRSEPTPQALAKVAVTKTGCLVTGWLQVAEKD